MLVLECDVCNFCYNMCSCSNRRSCSGRRSCAPVNNGILEFILLLLLQEILPDNDTGALAESRSGRSLVVSYLCIGQSLKSQPNLDLYLVRRYKICHFPMHGVIISLNRSEPKEPTQFGSVSGSMIKHLPFSRSGSQKFC